MVLAALTSLVMHQVVQTLLLLEHSQQGRESDYQHEHCPGDSTPVDYAWYSCPHLTPDGRGGDEEDGWIHR